MRKISIKIENRKYDISVEEDIVDEFEKSISKDLNIAGNNSIKDILEAYLKKNYEVVILKKRINKLLKKLEFKQNLN